MYVYLYIEREKEREVDITLLKIMCVKLSVLSDLNLV